MDDEVGIFFSGILIGIIFAVSIFMMGNCNQSAFEKSDNILYVFWKGDGDTSKEGYYEVNLDKKYETKEIFVEESR